jgi:hypothetical protein
MIKLIAKTQEDLQVISSLLQDGILPIGDFAFLKNDKKAMFAFNRFKHELYAENKNEKFRCNSVLTVNNVESIKYKNIDFTDRKQILVLLDIEKKEDNLILNFAENKKIKLIINNFKISIVDTSENWKVDMVPEHEGK